MKIFAPPVVPVMALAVLISACAGTPGGLEPQALRGDTAHFGYLDQTALNALAAEVPAPPPAGSLADLADQDVSETLRRFENTDRWLLATSHAEVRPPFALQHFDCALGLRFAPGSDRTPATARIFRKLFADAETVSTVVKRRAFRARPVGDDPRREACQTVSPAGRNSASYPSGSATVAAAYGAAMAVIAPENADDARSIGHQIAFSRAVCGMHYPTDVRVGIALGETVFEQASRDPAFAADLLEAQAEIKALRATGKTSPACSAERSALALGPEQL